jgi:X-X-X-Leu-X-X-Gly heptad repeat protein
MTNSVETLSQQTDQLVSGLNSLNNLADSFGNRMVKAFAGAVIYGRKFSDVLQGLALSLANSALTAGLKPLGNLLGGLFGNIFASARGSILSNGAIMPFASGGIVNSPTLFPLRGATGLMGEAGPEAIMPLARGPDGRLGVRGGGGTSVIVNISTPDARSFMSAQSQVSAMMARAVARGQRNL